MTRFQERIEGERIVNFFLIRDREIKTATNGKEYANFTLERDLDFIPARLWDINEEQKVVLQRRAVVKVDGLITSYRNQKQLNIQRIRLATDEDEVNITELLSKPGLSREELWHELRLLIDEIQSPVLSTLVKKVLSDKKIRDKVTTIPAAKLWHHTYYAGLLEHIVHLCQSIMQLIPLYPHINQDCVLTTAILHEIGKAEALEDPIAPDYTTKGELMGHIVLGIEMINQAAYEAGIPRDNEELIAVKHCILSQYGESEAAINQGFIVNKTAEAVFFHHLNQLNEKLNGLQIIHDGSTEPWVYSSMFKRKMYKKQTTNEHSHRKSEGFNDEDGKAR
ncbi:3'-5' exoribonuclease YhaM family protein [Halalkalibacterium ligniniphilum]|uniref:3'-5' exoribonuclease YhaM family protein n=1 Tax=Halalkalibacterium ligniniphilum TaxID=1134413 RepID=UPI00034C3170|nr:3'-5' exoribonuclease YhaM family protein [Halalkalibacterium ligniniphilum]